jgi:DNA topoisomerase-6 subunit B
MAKRKQKKARFSARSPEGGARPRKASPKKAKRPAAKRSTAKAKPARKRRPRSGPRPAPPPPAAKARQSAPPFATAESMARQLRSISVSEFFAKNRHLLGFDNPRKALLTTVKEAVDNALDACEEAGILPIVEIWIEPLGETRFKAVVEDNGPGIVRKQIPSIFGQLLYGSRFHRLRMARGQQGIGISAAGMYGLLTTGRPVRITSRTGKRSQAHYYELRIDTRRNRPAVIRDDVAEWDREHGTRVEIELEARYLRGRQSVDDYLEQTAIANPHVTLIYHAPDGRCDTYERSVSRLPALPKEVRPHPYGVELGVLIRMLHDTRARTLHQFLRSEFSRVSPRVAKAIVETAGVSAKARPARLGADDARAVYEAVQKTKILAPSTDSVVPIGQEQLVSGLRQVVEAGFCTAVTRRPAVYRGNPFIIEAAVAYGSAPQSEKQAPEAGKAKPPAEQAEKGDAQPARLIRFANRVPLQYQQSACATCKAVVGLNWRSYGLSQARGALPTGPLTIVVHMASVWVPFTSESKEAIASYPEILREIRLALQECGRKLSAHIRRTVRIRQELKKRSYIEKYIPAIGEALRDILDLKDRQVKKVCTDLKAVLERSRKL